MHQHLVNPPS